MSANDVDFQTDKKWSRARFSYVSFKDGVCGASRPRLKQGQAVLVKIVGLVVTGASSAVGS